MSKQVKYLNEISICVMFSLVKRAGNQTKGTKNVPGYSIKKQEIKNV